MTRAEVFEFLELIDDSVSDFQVKLRLEEKLAYHEDLSINAPSEFLRLIHSRSVQKAKEIKQEFPQWDINLPVTNIEFPLDDDAKAQLKQEEEAEELTTPLIVSSALLKKTDYLIPHPPAWLIRHTENLPDKTFILTIGNNYMGRKADPALNPFIILEKDSFISKVQAVISIEVADGSLAFYINDSAESNGGKASSNGTFINGNTQRITQKMKLEDGDAIQAGSTKLVLRVNNKPVQEIEKEVKRSKFIDTVVLK
ncbi:MAG: FHA domain-containing protein [Chitinophagaceae bacterium]|nr:FHA domain-containing protein [Chitinophagaceae bacterium]